MTRWFTLQSWFRRNGVTVALGIIIFANLGILLLLAQATSRIQEQQDTNTQILTQVSKVTDQISDVSKDRTNQINQLNRHLDCIVLFFSQPDRTQKSISDIETCTVQSNSGTPLTLSPSPEAATGSTTPAGVSTAPAAASGSSPSNATPTPEAAQPSFLDRVLFNPIKSIINIF